MNCKLAFCVSMLICLAAVNLSAQEGKKSANAKVTFPPTLPGGIEMASDTSPIGNAPGAAQRPPGRPLVGCPDCGSRRAQPLAESRVKAIDICLARDIPKGSKNVAQRLRALRATLGWVQWKPSTLNGLDPA